MLFIIGFVVVMGCVIGGYLMHNDNLAILWQPSEVIIICGAAIGAFVIGNTGTNAKAALKALGKLFKGKPYTKAKYLELLAFIFVVFKTAKSKGLLELESHIENPHESELFSKFPTVQHDHHLMDFFCDYIRVLAMGVDNHYMIEDLIDKELEIHHAEAHSAAAALNTFGESFPALGIVAAVLGVITTMGSIAEPPEILGGLIGAALVGTFMGILISYGIVCPMASFVEKFDTEEAAIHNCAKSAIVAYMQGNAPIIIVEFVRKNIPSAYRPSFKEVEERVNEAG